MNYTLILPLLIGYWLLFRKNYNKIGKAKKWLSQETIDLINQFCDEYLVPKGLIASMVLAESWDNPLKTGTVGEIGILQVTEGAFNEVKNYFKVNYQYNQLYVKKLGLLTGILYLKLLHEKYNLSWKNAVKAYNVGPDLKPKEAAERYWQKVEKYL